MVKSKPQVPITETQGTPTPSLTIPHLLPSSW